jgi:hypothetical protein
MMIPVKTGGIQTFAFVGHERLDNDDANEIADNYTVSLQHPEFLTNHFKIMMDEDDNIVTLDARNGWMTKVLLTSCLPSLFHINCVFWGWKGALSLTQIPASSN